MSNPYLPFEADIVYKVIRPEIIAVLTDPNLQIKSKGDLLTAFRAAYDTNVSLAVFNRWLKLADIQISRQTVVNYGKPDLIPPADDPKLAAMEAMTQFIDQNASVGT